MLLWFVGPSILIVWSVFRSPAADYRVVAVGALVPLVEVPFGHPRLFHSMTGAAVLLAVVMLAARGQRVVQRRLLGLPIGVLMHLVLDGAWADAHAFWWPFLGSSWSTSRLPELGRGGFDVVLEVFGAAACYWGFQRFRLHEPDRRRLFLQTGRVGRDLHP
ncbi:MAG: metal-dependent hydrolase [Microthrixaceae bacterium]